MIGTLPDVPVGDWQDAHALGDELGRALDLLSPRVRAVLVLRFHEALTETETARVLRCSTSTVRSYTARGLAAVRAALRPRTARLTDGNPS
ncbi:sigma factor-like helix-turn-helix DNA-binding protein [Geodermatophilus sp. SYSU D00814]